MPKKNVNYYLSKANDAIYDAIFICFVHLSRPQERIQIFKIVQLIR